MNTYFTVGELAKFSNISKQTLIYYDREGVFSPSQVGGENGYRYYSADQIEVLDSILILKEIGLPLRAIKEFMSNRSSENAVNVMKKQQKQIEENMAHLKLVSDRLQKKIKTLEDFFEHSNKQVVFERLDREWLATEPVAAPKSLENLDIALKKLLSRAGEKQYPYYYQLGDMVPMEALLHGDYTSFSYAFLPLEKAVSDSGMHEKPAGVYAKCYHTGPYHTVGTTYGLLLDEISRRGKKAVGYSYEYCILDSLTSGSNKEYITEIQVRLED